MNCLLPTAYVVREEVIFSLCLSVHRGGYPIQLAGGGVPRPAPGGGVPHPAGRGGGGYPIQVGGSPGVPPPAGGRPPGVPPPGWRIPPPPRLGYLLRRGRCASCVHAGGLSCCCCFYRIWNQGETSDDTFIVILVFNILGC